MEVEAPADEELVLGVRVAEGGFVVEPGAEDDKDPKHASKVFNLASKLGAGVAAMTGFGMATADGAVDGATGGMVSAAAVPSVDEDPSKLSAGTATPPNCVKVPLWICTATLAAALFGIVAITMTLPA